MKKFNKIVMSDVEPDINCIWLNNKTLLAYKNGKWVPILRGEKLPAYYIKGIVTEEYRNLNPNDWWKGLAAEIAPELQEPMPTNEKEFYKLVDKYINVIISEQEAAGNIISEEEKEAFKQQLYAELENLKNSYKPLIAEYYLEDGSLKKLDIKKDGSFIVNLEGRQNIIPFTNDKSFLQEITASSLPKIENLSEFLREYKNLQKAKLDLSEVTKYCNLLFYNCTSLEKLELNAPNVTFAEDMLYNSQNLIYAKINMPKLEVACSMFRSSGVKNTDIDMDMSNIKQTDSMFAYCKNITKVFDTPNIEIAYGMYQESGIKEVTATYDKLIDARYMFSNCSELVSANINLPKVTNFYKIFEECSNLESVVLNASSIIDASHVTTVIYNNVFNKCTKLKSAYITLDKATNIAGMFNGCKALNEVILNVPKVTDARYLFRDCPSLKSINLNLPEVTNMRAAFEASTALTNVSINAPKVTDLSYTFNVCAALKSVDIDLSKVTLISRCFARTAIESANFKLPEVIDSSSLFEGCKNLIEATIDMPKVLNVQNMFHSCSNLTRVTLNIPKVKHIYDLFYNCPMLEYIDLSSITNPETILDWDTCFRLVKNCTIKCTQAFKDFCLAHKTAMALDDSVTFDVID